MANSPYNPTPRQLLAIAAFSLVAASISTGEPAYTVSSFTMTIHGSSSLHDWESQVEQLETKGAVALASGKVDQTSGFEVEIPVLGIKSPHKRMDRLTYEALDAKTHPNIRYTLNELRPASDGRFASEGELFIAGTTLPLSMDIATSATTDGALSLTGHASFPMSDFGIKPPSLMLGAIKVGDAVKVTFQLTLSPKPTTHN